MNLTIELSDEMYQKLSRLASEAQKPMEQCTVDAVAEQISYWELQQRAVRGSRERLVALLAKVPDVEPEPHDRL